MSTIIQDVESKRALKREKQRRLSNRLKSTERSSSNNRTLVKSITQKSKGDII